MTHPHARWVAALVVIGSLLAGCRPGPAPVPTDTPLPPTAAPIPGTPTPEGWVRHETAAVVLWLPADWEVLALGEGDRQALFDAFQRSNPDLARTIGSADALAGVELWAFGVGDGTEDMADNLNIRRSPLDGQGPPDMQAVTGDVAAQYGELGWEVVEARAGLEIGGLPAGYVAYTFPMAGDDGRQVTVAGRQYLVATAAELWILSYTAGPGHETTLAQRFERSAESFRVR